MPLARQAISNAATAASTPVVVMEQTAPANGGDAGKAQATSAPSRP
jgi:hypothetical protein